MSGDLFSILLVDRTDTFRAPLAAALLRHELDTRGYGDVVVRSAGTDAKQGESISPRVAEVVPSLMANSTGPTTNQVSSDLVDRSHSILVMDRSQSEWLLERTPQAGDRIRTLGLCEAYKELREIPAVAGHTLADYQSTFHQIERAVLGLIDDWGFFRDRFFIQRKLHVAIGADHRGFAMKKTIIAHLEKAGHRVLDCGAYNSQPSDHPIIAIVVGEAVAQEAVDRGILICASGLGMSISANKVRGVRAALCINPDHAALSRTHNNANVLCLAADCFPEKEELEIIKVWMSTPFLGGKYQRRNNIISCQEDSYRRDLSANDRPTMPDDSAE